jgi:hypothetical protein
MATVTPNFNWPVPTSTDLVKDGATAIEALGDSIDASLVDLKGGTTGQVLSKNSNTDMDFVWVTNADGDITGVTVTSPLTGGGTSGTVTVGILNGTTSNLGAVQLSDSTSSTSTTLAATANAVKTTYDLAASAYAPAFTNNFYAGKNKIINGDFGIWQRGTSFTITGQANLVDRWLWTGGGSGATRTLTQQTFTPGTAPVAGYEGTFFARYTQSVAGTGSTFNQFQTRIEDVRTLAGQTATVSFWAKADAARSLDLIFGQNFGSGGSGSVETSFTPSSVTLTTSWARYTATVNVPSVSGKTIGANSYAFFYFGMPNNTVQTIDYWGVQLEAGSTATPFTTASGGSVEGELAMCQRYYFRAGGDNVYQYLAGGLASSTTETRFGFQPPVTMRIAPTSVEYSTLATYDVGAAQILTVTSLTIANASKAMTSLTANVSSGLTTYRPLFLITNNSTSGYVALNAEL